MTAAYKRKLEEDKKWLEEEKMKEELEAKQDVRKRGHMGDFYRQALKTPAFLFTVQLHRKIIFLASFSAVASAHHVANKTTGNNICKDTDAINLCRESTALHPANPVSNLTATAKGFGLSPVSPHASKTV